MSISHSTRLRHAELCYRRKENTDISSIPLFGNRGGASPVNATPSKGTNVPRNDTHHMISARAPKAFDQLNTRTIVKSTPKIQIIRSRQIVQSSGSEDSDSASDHSDVFELSDGSPPRLSHKPSVLATNLTEPEPVAAEATRRAKTDDIATQIT